MKVAIRADGGSDIGYGHLIRTSTVARECLTAGDEVVYLTRTPDAVAHQLPSEVTVAEVDSQSEQSQVIEYIEEHGISAIFTDSFVVDTEYQERLSNTDAKVIVRHNYKDYDVCCDALIYGELHATEMEYNWIGSKPTLCLGPDYILLREQFRKQMSENEKRQGSKQRALITMGGSDVNSTTPVVMRALAGFDGIVDVVVGPGYSNKKEIRQSAGSIDTEFNVIYDVQNMAEIMRRAEFAVTSTGGTVFELLATETPFIGIPQVDNQRERAAALKRRNLAAIINESGKLDQKIKKIESESYREKMRENMKGVVDGRGAERTYEQIHSR